MVHKGTSRNYKPVPGSAHPIAKIIVFKEPSPKTGIEPTDFLQNGSLYGNTKPNQHIDVSILSVVSRKLVCEELQIVKASVGGIDSLKVADIV